MKLVYNLLLLLLLYSKVLFSENLISNDLKNSLTNLYNYSPKLKYDRELLKSKDELLPQAYSEFRPEITGYYQKGKIDTNSSGFNITSDGVRTETNKGVVITQQIFDGGSSLSNISVAKNEINVQRSLLKQSEQETFLEAIKLYAELATEISSLKKNEKNVEFLKGQLNLTKQQFDIGEVTLTDVSIAESRYSLSESQLLKTKNIINSLTAKYSALFGLIPEHPKIDLLFEQISINKNKAKEYSKKNNPKLLSIFWKIKSLKKQIESLHRKKLPSVKLEAEAKINEGYFRTDSSREVLSAYTKVDIPLYQSGTASSKIREAKKKLFAQKELYKQYKNEIEYNLISSISSYNYSYAMIEAYRKQIESNKIFLEGLEQELLLGERTTLDVLDGEQELVKSELDLINAYKDLFISYFEILFYQGNLNASYLKLSVRDFDATQNLERVKFKWLDIID